MTALTVVDHASPEEVFTVLSDDTRIAILQALWRADDPPVPFSDLREAVGLRDSGQFNYHLKELCGRFVHKTDEGYCLSQAGHQINGVIEAGSYTMDGTIDPIGLETSCRACGDDRYLRYEDETVIIECDACPIGYQFGVPPAALANYDRDVVPMVASRYLRTTINHLENGFCPYCERGVTPTVKPITSIDPCPDDVETDVPPAVADDLDSLPLVQYRCPHCGVSPTISLRLAHIDHPAVSGFYYEHGIDVTEVCIWEFADIDPTQDRIVSDDPVRAEVTYAIDGMTLTIVVDETGTVQTIDRGQRRTSETGVVSRSQST